MTDEVRLDFNNGHHFLNVLKFPFSPFLCPMAVLGVNVGVVAVVSVEWTELGLSQGVGVL